MGDLPQTASKPAKKRVAVFLDGTWNTTNDDTNVWRLKALCASKSNDGLQQISFYSAGIGTKFGDKVRGGMLGYGLNDEVIKAYDWLIESYNPGDDLYLFGFSRGAYTARSLSGLIAKFGLLVPGAPLSVNELYARYRLASAARTLRKLLSDKEEGKNNFSVEEQWMLKYSQPIDIEFIGVWDTVGALGIPIGNIPGFGKADMQFLNTGIRAPNRFAFHALAIDEHRKAFAPTLWTVDTPKALEPDTPPPRTLEQVEQRRFVGAHANVGGGYPSDPLAQQPLKWLMGKADQHGLSFKRNVEIDGDVLAAPISDSYAPFMGGLYKFVSRRFYREIGQQPFEDGNSIRSTINETMDPSVFDRWNRDSDYRPANLVNWVKKYGGDPSKLRTAVMAHDPKVPV
jgi:uncharacterized protein (DUF2235 family)